MKRRVLTMLAACLAFVCLLTAGCGDKVQEAREALDKQNVEYSAEGFNRAIEADDTKIIDLFFQSQFDVSLGDDAGKTPLMAAAECGNGKVAGRILELDAERLDDADKNGHTALAWAIREHQTAMLELLTNAKWNVIDRDGNTLLHLAALSGDLTAAQAVLAHEVDVNRRNAAGATALSFAAGRGDADMTSLLLGYGADAGIADDGGQRPLDLAHQGGFDAVLTLLAPVTPERQNTVKPQTDMPDVEMSLPYNTSSASVPDVAEPYIPSATPKQDILRKIITP